MEQNSIQQNNPTSINNDKFHFFRFKFWLIIIIALIIIVFIVYFLRLRRSISTPLVNDNQIVPIIDAGKQNTNESANQVIKPPVQPITSDSQEADVDQDILSDLREKTAGTSPDRADTDGDGLSDGNEVLISRTDPLNIDSDGDGLIDFQEIYDYKTNPLTEDTDDDGLTDYQEIWDHGSDPLKADTDGDGYADGQEVKGGYNPLGEGKLEE